MLGRRLLGHALGGKRLEEIAPENIAKVLQDTKHETLDGLLADIGLGNAMSVVIARRLLGNVRLNLEHSLRSMCAACRIEVERHGHLRQLLPPDPG